MGRVLASIVLALASVSCMPDIVPQVDDGGTESESGTETETGDVEPICPPEQTEWPIGCSLPLTCPHLDIDIWGNAPDPDITLCMLEALRDRRVGRYSYHLYTGYTDDHVQFQILDELHVQSAGYGWTDYGWQCMISARVSLLRAPEVFDACIALVDGVERAECATNFAGVSVPDPEMVVCPMP
jgi:hypothetical protein